MCFKFIEPLVFTLRQIKTGFFIIVSMFGYITKITIILGMKATSITTDISAGIDMFHLSMSSVINSSQVLV